MVIMYRKQTVESSPKNFKKSSRNEPRRPRPGGGMAHLRKGGRRAMYPRRPRRVASARLRQGGRRAMYPRRPRRVASARLRQGGRRAMYPRRPRRVASARLRQGGRRAMYPRRPRRVASARLRQGGRRAMYPRRPRRVAHWSTRNPKFHLRPPFGRAGARPSRLNVRFHCGTLRSEITHHHMRTPRAEGGAGTLCAVPPSLVPT